MNPRLGLAVSGGRLAAGASRLLGRGGGTALPGLVAARIDPNVVRGLGRQLSGGRILITGTNGKTTTSRILASILAATGQSVLHNREGSNMMRGFASTLVGAAGVNGRLRVGPSGTEAVGLFETDEATMPAAASALAPTIMAFTNLFRDQLDRYGEVDTVAAMWREALVLAPQSGTLVLNSDDPSVAELELGWGGPIEWFGIDDPAFASEKQGAFDARWCRACGGTFVYERRYFAHVGWWRCSGCGRSRREPGTSASEVTLKAGTATFTVAGLGEVEMPLTGIYNVYNALAAIAVARVLGVPNEAIRRGLATVEAAFGRQEEVLLEGRRIHLMLCKNPAGANEVIRLLAALAEDAGRMRVAVALSDRFADGQDVSWIWDVDYELLAASVQTAWAGGSRAADMALRLKYAGWPELAAAEESAGALLDAIVAGSADGDDVYLIPTYTAMLDIRAELVRRGAAAAFWS